MDIPNNTSKSACVYTRVSTAGQADDRAVSLDEQLADCLAYAETRGLEVVSHYQDVGPGIDPDRPQFRAMLEDARRNWFNAIIVWRADRLSRGISSAGPVDGVLREREILGTPLALLSVKDSVDARIFGVLAWAAGEESNAIRQRTVMGKNASARAGRIPSGAVPFGYRIGDDGKPVIHETEAEVVRSIFKWYLDGVSVSVIARDVEALGHPMHQNRVHDLLRATTYKGFQVYGGTRRLRVGVDKGTTVAQPAEARIDIPYPVLIDPAEWGRVQELKKSKQFYSKRSTKSFYMVAKMVRCGECGNVMAGLTKNPPAGRNRPPIRYYRCRGARMGLRCREKSYIPADKLEGSVWREVEAMLTDPEQFFDVLDEDHAGAELDAALEDARRALTKVQREEERLVRLYVLGKIDDDMLTRQRRFITERLEHEQDQVNALHQLQQANLDRVEMGNTITAWAGRIGEGIDTLDDKGKQGIIRLVVDHATLSRDNLLTIAFAVGLVPGTWACRWAT